MRTIAILNLKGGVGKTTTVINLAAILAGDYQQRVLLVDADSQANLTEFFHPDADEPGLADLLIEAAIGTSDVAEAYIHPTDTERISLIPSTLSLMDLDIVRGAQRAGEPRALRDTLHAIEEDSPPSERYDWCLIDCPPALNTATSAALLAAQEVIIPIKLDAFSLAGLANLRHQIACVRQINPDLRLLGCLPTMWYNSQLTNEALRTLHEVGLPTYQPIRRSDKVDMMTYAQTPLRICSPRSAAGVDYRRLVGLMMDGGDRSE